MGLELKTALSRRHRDGKLKASPDALLWVFHQLRQMPRVPTGSENPKGQPHRVAMHLWRQAQNQFGAMTEAVLTHWALASGLQLAVCFQDLSEMDAIRFENHESASDFETIGNWNQPNQPSPPSET